MKEKDPQTETLGDSASKNAAAFASLQGQDAALYQTFQTSTKRIEEEMLKQATKVSNQEPSIVSPQPVTPLVTQSPEIIIRREFKINGQIGERGQRDKLSYSNLMHQIRHGTEGKS